MKNNLPQYNEQRRIHLVARIVLLYFLILGGVDGAIVHFKPNLYQQVFPWRPTLLLFLVWFLYYILPFVLALIFGYIFRPFGKNFRNVYFSIFIIQLFYSFIVGMLRWEYAQAFTDQLQWKKSDRIKIINLASQQFDRDENGFIEEIKVSVEFDFKKIRPGEYLIDAAIVPGASLSPFLVDGGGLFTIAKTGQTNRIKKDFVVTARDNCMNVDCQLQDFQIKILLFRIANVDSYGKKLLLFSRWSPFLRDTNWEGLDKKIYGDWILRDDHLLPEVYSIRTPITKI